MLEENIEPTDNKRLLLLRYIHNELRGTESGVAYLFPSYLYSRFGIDLQVIQSVLSYLEDKEFIEILQKPSQLSAERRSKVDDQNYFFIDIKPTFGGHFQIIHDAAEFFGADSATIQQPVRGARAAVLTFEDIIFPVVTVGAYMYKLPGMYDGSNPLKIISFCMERHPAETISLDQLKDEMSKAKRPLHGVDQLTTALRRTHFDRKGPLRPFIAVSSKQIQVNVIAHLNDEQLRKIKAASKKLE